MKQEGIDDDIYNQVESNKKKTIQGVLDRLNRSLDEIQPLWPQATKLELYIAFDKSSHDPNQLVIDIEDKRFQEYIRDSAKELIEQVNSTKRTRSKSKSKNFSSVYNRALRDDDSDFLNEEEEKEEDQANDDDSDFQNDSEPPKKWNLRNSTKSSHSYSNQQDDDSDDEGNNQNANENISSKQENSNSDTNFSDDVSEKSDDDDFSYTSKSSKKSKKLKKKAKTASENTTKVTKRKFKKEQEGSNLPRPKEISKADWDTWSFAHKQSYLKGVKNSNAYFYRNLRQGEKPRNGKWTPEETRVFLARIKEMTKKNFYDTTPQWGIFSMVIPGRVGYQCANYYRNLVLEGRIYDPRYKVIDGKLKYIAFHQKDSNNSNKSKKNDKDKDNDNDNYEGNGGNDEKLSIYERYARENPLIGAVDTLTREKIRVPALSPDGYLLDYNTWLKIIAETGCDPYTTNHLTKRSLVILNYDNIEEYRDKIKNLVIEE